MTPPESFVHDLRLYDDKLRVRWAIHTKKWLIERKLETRNPQYQGERPLSASRSPLARDLYDGWVDGYLHVLTVPQDLLHWRFVAPVLAQADAWRQGGMDTLNRQLEEADEAKEKAADKAIDHWAEGATSESFDRIKWLTGQRVAVSTPEPQYEQRDGYKLRDRRVSLGRL